MAKRDKKHHSSVSAHKAIRAGSRQQTAQTSAPREGNSDKEPGMQTIGPLQMVSETHNDNILGNNNDSSNGRADQVRAFRIRVGGEELVAISTQVWDPAIGSMLPSLPQKIVRLLVLGKGQQEVADELGIQLQTVSNSVHALYKREDGLADTMAHLASKLYPPLFKIKSE